MKINCDQKTEELSAANLYQMLEEYGRTRSKPPSEDSKEETDAGDADGTLLNQAVVENLPTMQEALQYTEQILYGLRHAHKEGLVHRDVKTEGGESK